ncbi:RNA-binding protein 34 [Anoplopoma fimbria]|uniref:RNA-binding protein 34 n=1 Tax=Anoplopoma fimbria TaxID=229290 RepID=UPI0023EB5997|nr:RNA-binding protein 34 [Anoplopoma fimbria]XP_054460062.1 RNA-binding protein 34 [Anoplopoma fimbria]
MKKAPKKSEEALSGQPPADYEVGQVSGSLFKKKSAASGSLSALFSTAAPAGPLLFQPAPKPVQKITEEKEEQKETPEVKGQPGQKKKTNQKQLLEKSEADQKLENREISLQNADEDEQGPAAPAKKKKRKAPEPDGQTSAEQWVMKRQKLKAVKEEEAMKVKRTVFVGNLPISCNRKTLQSLFRDQGSIESIRFRSVVREDPLMSRKVAVIQRKIHPKKQSMNAYVVFKDEAAVANALERNGMEIETGFHIRVDKVTDGTSYDNKRSVFVGNLSFEMKELTFRRHFEECGPVEAVRVVRDQNSGLGKGFGYILFESADSVQLALELDGTKLEGRPIRVKRAERQKNKTDSKGTKGRTDKGPMKGPKKGPMKGSGQERGGFKSNKKFSGNQQNLTKSSNSFKGEMVDHIKKKVLKKKQKPRKKVHI